MSLQRVSSIETFHSLQTPGTDDDVFAHPSRHRRHPPRRRAGSASSSVSASVRARKLTFNPLPESWGRLRRPEEGAGPLTAEDSTVGAFEVPRWKRILQVAVTVIYCLFSAGVVFGYAALKPVLKTEGAYRDVCDGEDTCIEIHLNLMFTTAAVATNVAALPIGAILDYAGPRVCACLGALFVAAGGLVMAHATHLPFDGFLVGYLLLALGGPFTYISSFQLSNAFPQHSGLILALLTGAFDASSALFLLYRVVFERSGGSFGHRRFFLAYLVVPAVILILQLTIPPARSYKTMGEVMEHMDDMEISGPGAPDVQVDDQVDEHTALLREEERQNAIHEIQSLVGSDRADKRVRREEEKNERSGVWGVMHSGTAWQQMRSWWFWLICLFTMVQMTRINYFVATIRPQYEALLGSERRAIEVNNVFDLALPLGGILSIPFIGAILDHSSTVAVLSTLVVVASAIGLLGLLPYMWAAYGNVCLFVLYRPFYYTAVSDYSAKVFGFRTFGTVYGAIICLSGLFNFSQSPLDSLFHRTFAGDPLPVNVGLLALGLLIGASLVAYVACQARSIRRRQAPSVGGVKRAEIRVAGRYGAGGGARPLSPGARSEV